MLVALMSDAHDEQENLLKAVRLAKEAECRHLLYLGDLCTVETLRVLRQAWPLELDLVSGNNDYPRVMFEECVREWQNTRFHADTARLTVETRRILMTHVPGYALQLAAESGKYDAVFFGHTHRPTCAKIGCAVVANPGDLQGRFAAPSFAVYDTETNSVTMVPLDSTLSTSCITSSTI